MTDGGTYTLLVSLAADATVEVGALGEHRLPAGWYAYVGSALGPGGFARIDRHRAVAAGDRDVRHWHVDYLLSHSDASVDAAVRSAGIDAECAVADAIDGERIAGFGCSDCECNSHLIHRHDRRSLARGVERAHRQVRTS